MVLFDRKLIKKNTTKYTNKHTEFNFPLGGIGTGCVSVDSRGAFTDWEIFNNPNKGKRLPYSFFCIATKFGDEERKINILEGSLNKPYNVNFPDGYPRNLLAGVPRFDRTVATGKGGILEIEFFKKTLPLKIKLTAFSPLIPGDEDNSGIPAISFRYAVENTSGKDCEVTVCYSQTNFTSFNGLNQFNELMINKPLTNVAFKEKGLSGIFMSSEEDRNCEYYGDMSIGTTHPHPSIKPRWNKGGWNDTCQSFFNDILDDGLLDSACTRVKNEDAPLEFISPTETGSIAIKETLKPGEEKVFDFILSWSFPNRAKSWKGHICPARDYCGEVVKNYYAYRFKDSKQSMIYLSKKHRFLYRGSKYFADALYTSNVGKNIIESINTTLAVLRSPTCFRINKTGDFLSWEGCFLDRGSCEGNCTHVWNYAQTHQYLFPRLEQSFLRTSFLQETDDEGYMAFRAMQILGDKKWEMLPALDGHFGMVSRLYRDYMFTGNDSCVKECLDKMIKVMEYSLNNWDKDNDGVIDGKQHNTYDIEFFGYSSMINSLFYNALLSASNICASFHMDDLANKYLNIYKNGSVKMDAMLFNGEYYVQGINNIDEHKYQYGSGVLSDQLFGQTLAHINGFNYLFKEEHVLKAMDSIMKNNYKDDMSEHLNIQRTYAINDDSGLILCSWPKGTIRPAFPFPYSDEVWTGIEYQVATELLYEQRDELANKIINSVLNRYNGYKRNPYNQIECGNHYTRSLASYGLLLGKLGLIYQMNENRIRVRKQKEKTTAFISFERGFGLLNIDGETATIQKVFGEIPEICIELY